ncbi:MAG: hypothetical protein IJH31_02795 [Erysipelotrichaceae bacterium]|nr:hypothetical protein [Erysipelotrichaceae bacterium]
MKKLLVVLFSLLIALALVGCTKAPEANNEEEVAEEATGKYTVYNMTGHDVTELYLYEAGSADKGENYAAEKAIAPEKVVKLEYTAASDAVLVLEFTTEEGTRSFDTLHIEEAPISLLSVDAAAGATNISFTAGTGVGVYNVTNATGGTVSAIYMYPEGSEDKGTNYAGEAGLADGESVTIEIEGVLGQNHIFEFVDATGEARTFDTLHIEVASFDLLSVDAAAGATNIKFGY